MKTHSALARAMTFADDYGLRVPILLAPMAGACPPSLSTAVMRAGGLGACGALLMQPDEIKAWATELVNSVDSPFQLNLWIPDPEPVRDATAEGAICNFLNAWGPEVTRNNGDATPPDFAAQCEAILHVRPSVISSIMGVYPPEFVTRMKACGIRWFATVTTVAEAKIAEQAGADAIVAQGTEAGGHRGAFEAANAEAQTIGLVSLVPAIVDAVSLPVIATGGIADARGVSAALLLGASAVQIGSGFLRSSEAKLPPPWADAIAGCAPEQTIITRAFSGRAGRSVATKYALAATAVDAPAPAPYPVQRGLTQAMRAAAVRENDIDRMQAWAGQSAALARLGSATEITRTLWDEARSMLETNT